MEGIIEAIRSIFTNDYGIDLESIIIITLPLWIFLMVKYREKEFLFKIYITLTIIYITKVIDLTILPLPLNMNSVEQMRRTFPYNFDYNVNLTPSFLLYFKDRGIYAFQSDMLNIIMFIPMGMIMAFTYEHDSFKKIVFKLFSVTLIIELTQFITGFLIGSSDRIADTNDLVMNTIGGVIGYLIFNYIIVNLFSRYFNGREIYDIKK